MSTPQPVPGRVAQAAAAGVTVHPVVQHVVDALEAHLKAVLDAVRIGSPAAIQHAVDFAQGVFAKLDEFGLEFRTHLVEFETALGALGLSNRPQVQGGATETGGNPTGAVSGGSGKAPGAS